MAPLASLPSCPAPTPPLLHSTRSTRQTATALPFAPRPWRLARTRPWGAVPPCPRAAGATAALATLAASPAPPTLVQWPPPLSPPLWFKPSPPPPACLEAAASTQALPPAQSLSRPLRPAAACPLVAAVKATRPGMFLIRAWVGCPGHTPFPPPLALARRWSPQLPWAAASPPAPLAFPLSSPAPRAPPCPWAPCPWGAGPPTTFKRWASWAFTRTQTAAPQ
jgi:hypothetical protein